MGAAFPLQVKSFKRHRNLLDDITAEDINAIQDEVVAIQQTLGTLLTRQVAVATPPPPVVEEGAPPPPPPAPQVSVNEFTSLADRLASIEAGRHVAAFEGKNTVGGQSQGNDVLLPLNETGTSTHDCLRDGIFYIPVSGFWIVEGSATVQALGSSNRTAYMDLKLGTRFKTTVIPILPGSSSRSEQVAGARVSASGWYRAGEALPLKLSGYDSNRSSIDVRWDNATVAATLIRTQ